MLTGIKASIGFKLKSMYSIFLTYLYDKLHNLYFIQDMLWVKYMGKLYEKKRRLELERFAPNNFNNLRQRLLQEEFERYVNECDK